MTTLFDLGGASAYPRIIRSPTAPSPVVDGVVWLDTTNNSWHIGQGGTWVAMAGGGGAGAPAGPPATVSPTAPAGAAVGDIWVDTSGAASVAKVMTTAGTWTEIAPKRAAVEIGVTAPTGAEVGDLWIDTTGGTPELKAMTTAGTWTILQSLDANGKIDPGLLAVEPTTFRGTADVTVAYHPPSKPGDEPNPGDFRIVQTTGLADASWAAVGVTGHQDAGDMLIWDGFVWHAIEHGINITPTVDVQPATAGQTVFTLNSAPSHDLFVMLNGAGMIPGNDYTRAADKITFVQPLNAGDVMEARYY